MYQPLKIKIIFASNNSGKFQEIVGAIREPPLNTGGSPVQYEIIPQSEFDVPEIEETGLTFVENAILKARNACKYTDLPAIADDSGLEIDALDGRPGIYSSRYADASTKGRGDPAPTRTVRNITKVLQELKHIPEPERTARFQCVMVYLRNAEDPAPIICQGTWEGRILAKEQGDQGFGYDPIFWVPTHNCSAAELSLAIKNQISHRGQALQKLLYCLANLINN